MSIYDEMTPEQRGSEATASTVLNLLGGTVGLWAIFVGATTLNSGINMTLESFEKDHGSSVVRAEIKRQMDGRIDAMRDQFLAVADKNPDGDKVISLDTGGESLLIDREAMNKRIKYQYAGETLTRKLLGGTLSVLGGGMVGLSLISIRRERRNMQAAAAKDTPSPAPQ